LIRRTFTLLANHDEETLALFRDRLRLLNPALLRRLIDQNDTQPRRLLEILALVVALLDNPPALRTQAKLLEVQRRQNHITDEQVQQGFAALLWVIEQQLGDAFTSDIQNAWVQLFRFLTELAAGAAP
jgi:nitric oxide dioxygenase